MQKSKTTSKAAPKKTSAKKTVARKSPKKAVVKVVTVGMPWPPMYGWGAVEVGDTEIVEFREDCMPKTDDLPRRTTKILRGPKSADGCVTIREWVGKQIDAGCFTRAQILAKFKVVYPHANQSQGGRYVTSAFNPTYCFKRWGKKAHKNEKGVISWITK